MKKAIIALAAAMLAVSCIKVTPEQTIDKLYNYFSAENEYVPAASEYSNAEDIAVAIATETKIKEIWTLEANGATNVFGEIKGVKKPDQIILLSTSIENGPGCAAIIEMMKAYGKLKIKSNCTIQLAFYHGETDGMNVLADALGDTRDHILFELQLDKESVYGPKTFVIGENDRFFEQITEVIPPYLNVHDKFNFVQGEEYTPGWPLSVRLYNYKVNQSDFAKDVAALASFVFLMN